MFEICRRTNCMRWNKNHGHCTDWLTEPECKELHHEMAYELERSKTYAEALEGNINDLSALYGSTSVGEYIPSMDLQEYLYAHGFQVRPLVWPDDELEWEVDGTEELTVDEPEEVWDIDEHEELEDE